jgi:hypothetical protein
MNNPLITKITPENCHKFHTEMRLQGIDLDKFCRCKDDPCTGNSYIHPRKSEDEITQKFLAQSREMEA